MAIQINIINKSTNPLPRYVTEHASGMDICAFLEKDVRLEPSERKLIPTGIFISLPAGIEAQIRPRSGLAIHHGITVLNSPGTIDPDYRGEIKIILINLGKDPYVIKNGDRIAQLIIHRMETVEWNEVKFLEDTERGEGGFGHSGINRE